MRCLHCNHELVETSADFSLRVMLCGSCGAKALKLRNRVRSELQALLARVDNAVRAGVLAKDVDLEAPLDSPQSVLELVLRLDAQWQSTQTPSSRPLKPPAITAGGFGSSPKRLVQDSR